MTIIRSRLKSPDYIFSKDQVPFLKVLGIRLYLKRSLMPFIEGYNTLLKGYMFSIEVRCLCLWVKCYYWRSYTLLKVRLSLLKVMLIINRSIKHLWRSDSLYLKEPCYLYWIISFFFMRKCQLDYSQSKIV